MLVSNTQFAVYVLFTLIGGVAALNAQGWVERVGGSMLFGEFVAATWFIKLPWFEWFGPAAWAAFILFTFLSLVFTEHDRLKAQETAA